MRFPRSFTRSRSLAENKARMIEAHRNEDWDLAKTLSVEKQALKKKRACEKCGVTVSPSSRFCGMHGHRGRGNGVGRLTTEVLS